MCTERSWELLMKGIYQIKNRINGKRYSRTTIGDVVNKRSWKNI